MKRLRKVRKKLKAALKATTESHETMRAVVATLVKKQREEEEAARKAEEARQNRLSMGQKARKMSTKLSRGISEASDSIEETALSMAMVDVGQKPDDLPVVSTMPKEIQLEMQVR